MSKKTKLAKKEKKAIIKAAMKAAKKAAKKSLKGAKKAGKVKVDREDPAVKTSPFST
jgi:hypothetical protein